VLAFLTISLRSFSFHSCRKSQTESTLSFWPVSWPLASFWRFWESHASRFPIHDWFFPYQYNYFHFHRQLSSDFLDHWTLASKVLQNCFEVQVDTAQPRKNHLTEFLISKFMQCQPFNATSIWPLHKCLDMICTSKCWSTITFGLEWNRSGSDGLRHVISKYIFAWCVSGFSGPPYISARCKVGALGSLSQVIASR